MLKRFLKVCEGALRHRRKVVVGALRKAFEDPFEQVGLAGRGESFERGRGGAIEEARGEDEVEELDRPRLAGYTGSGEVCREMIQDHWQLEQVAAVRSRIS